VARPSERKKIVVASSSRESSVYGDSFAKSWTGYSLAGYDLQQIRNDIVRLCAIALMAFSRREAIIGKFGRELTAISEKIRKRVEFDRHTFFRHFQRPVGLFDWVFREAS
jgi:hypothetical protein